jgi:hypothetical protein
LISHTDGRAEMSVFKNRVLRGSIFGLKRDEVRRIEKIAQ